jgi:hypothetical protein
MGLNGWQRASISAKGSRNQEVHTQVDEPMVRLELIRVKASQDPVDRLHPWALLLQLTVYGPTKAQVSVSISACEGSMWQLSDVPPSIAGCSGGMCMLPSRVFSPLISTMKKNDLAHCRSGFALTYSRMRRMKVFR